MFSCKAGAYHKELLFWDLKYMTRLKIMFVTTIVIKSDEKEACKQGRSLPE
jgi:hypothetical protein